MPFQGQAAPAPLAAPTGPPPPAGSPAPWPPPPSATGAPGLGQQTEPQAPLSDTMERMLRPQGIFQHRLPPPAEWQQPYPPAPGAYPPGGQYPPGNPYPQGGPAPYPPPPAPYPPGNQPPPPDPGQQPWGPGGGQYPQGGAYQDPYGNTQFPGGQFGPGQFGPGVQYGPDGMPLATGGSAGGGRGLLGKLPFKGPLVPVGIAAAVVIIVAVVAFTMSQGGSTSSNGQTGMAMGTSGASSSPGSTALTQQQAASALSGLLSQSGTDHSDVNAAVTNVENCKSLPADARTFNKAAANRRTLLTKLAQLPGRSALPAAMLTDLTNGWQASATVDADLAKWATAEAGHCKKNDLKNPAYTASLPFDSKATNGKSAFVGQWNGLAKKYSLPTYQPSQI
jgi:hypothetical protein